MGRIYTVEFENRVVANADATHDLFELTPATDQPIEIQGIFLSQSTEVGDASEEQLRIQVIRGHATSGSGGAAATPRPTNPNDAAAGFTAEVENTTVASTGTPVNLHSDTWNVRVPFSPPELPGWFWGCSAAETLIVVRLLSTVTDDITMSGTLYVWEY